MKLFTSEQVSAGHPDKICDQISDAIVTECIKQDRKSRVAVETLIKDYDVVVAGELTTNAQIDVEETIKKVLESIGLENIERYTITNLIGKQSIDIAQGVDTGGAGDQGMMFGYATDETQELMPMPYILATRSLIKLKNLKHPLLKPDAKAQVTFDYDTNQIVTFLISTQHDPDITEATLYALVYQVMIDTAKEYNLNTDFKMLVNPTGRFVIGSSFGDSGVTGRKIICDTYGGAGRHGGGAFSGKDPSKVDRSGAYISRNIAKSIVANKLARRCEVQLSYAIGVAEPTSINIDTFGTSYYTEAELVEAVENSYDLTPNGIIKELRLLTINYLNIASYGHFGRSCAIAPWELTKDIKVKRRK